MRPCLSRTPALCNRLSRYVKFEVCELGARRRLRVVKGDELSEYFNHLTALKLLANKAQ